MKKLTIELFDDLNCDVSIYQDDDKDSAFEDDCFIHIIRNGLRIVFYNGQDKGRFTQKDVARFEKLVDKRLAE